MVKELKRHIDNNRLKKSKSYFNFALHRGYNNLYENNYYNLEIALKSDSETILTAYENDNNITLEEIKKLPLEDGAKRTIQRYIDSNINVYDFLVKCNIFKYPHRIKIFRTKDIKEIEKIFELIKKFRELVENGSIDLSLSEYDFISGKKRRKKKKKEIIPKCHEGLCIEHNIEKALSPFAREAF